MAGNRPIPRPTRINTAGGGVVIWPPANPVNTVAPARCSGCKHLIGLITLAKAQEHADSCDVVPS